MDSDHQCSYCLIPLRSKPMNLMPLLHVCVMLYRACFCLRVSTCQDTSKTSVSTAARRYTSSSNIIVFQRIFTIIVIDFQVYLRSCKGNFFNSELSNFRFFKLGPKSSRKRPQTIPKVSPNHPKSIPKFSVVSKNLGILEAEGCFLFSGLLLLRRNLAQSTKWVRSLVKNTGFAYQTLPSTDS